MARSSPSTTPAAPTSASSRSGLGEKRAPNLVYQAFDLLYLDGRLAARRRPRGPQAPAQERAPAASARPLRGPRRGRGRDVPRGGRGPGPRRHRRQAQALALRARSPLERPGSRSRSGPSRSSSSAAGPPGTGNARDLGALVGRRLRGRQAPVQRQGRVGVHRGEPPDPPRARSRRSRWTTRRSTRRRPRTIAVAGAATCVGVDLGPSGARHPRRARRLVARRDGPPVRVQGDRARPRPDDRLARARGRHGVRGP